MPAHATSLSLYQRPIFIIFHISLVHQDTGTIPSHVVTVLMLLDGIIPVPVSHELKRQLANAKPQDVEEDMNSGGPGTHGGADKR